MKKSELIRVLGLKPLTIEGGHFAETHRDGLQIPKSALPPSFRAENYAASTAIYYMLSAGETSSMHSVSADETWHFYRAGRDGVFVELLTVSPDGESELVRLGPAIERGEKPQHTVKKGLWMGARTVSANGASDPETCWALMGATVAPSFEYADFTKGDAEEIARICPERAALIRALG